MSIQSDHGGEFQNERFEHFCEKHGMKHNFSTPRTPQQNGVVERKNRSLEELARTMSNENSLPKYFWIDAINITCYVLNRRRPILSHLKVFGCKCSILNNGKEQLGKFNVKADEGVFLGYVIQSHAYKVCNKRLMTVEESMHVVFDKTNPNLQDQVSKNADDEDLLQEKNYAAEKQSVVENQSTKKEKQPTKKKEKQQLT